MAGNGPMEQFSQLIDEIPITNKIAPPAGTSFPLVKPATPLQGLYFMHLVESASVADEHNGN